jgi:uncharacterized protein YigE (DUF2233 family)
MGPCNKRKLHHPLTVRWFSLLLAALILSSCSSWNRSPGEAEFTNAFPLGPSPEEPLAHLDPQLPIAPVALPQTPRPAFDFSGLNPVHPTLPAGVHHLNSRGVSLTFLTFDDRDYGLAVADKGAGPATEWQSAQEAAKAHQALAAINASFFTPEGKPLGLVIENGSRIGTWNASSSFTSGVLSVGKSPRLLRRKHWRSFSPTKHLVQAGPFLLENGSPVAGLDNKEQRPRSFILWNGSHHWALGYTQSATLAELSAALAANSLSILSITTALNLDGGRSCDLWVSPSINGGPISTRRIWNNPVRNYVLLVKR